MSDRIPTGRGQIATRPMVFALLAFLVGLSYLNTLRNDFVGDDYLIVAKNKRITRLEALPKLVTSDYWANYRGPYEAAPSQSSGLYRPLTMVTYALNYAISGSDPAGYHLVNLLLHLLVSWLVFLFASEIGVTKSGAVIAASIFAVHPLHTEAVTGIVGRAELLMTIGVLMALWLAFQGRRFLSIGAFAAGLLSKEQAVVVPALLLAAQICLPRRPESAITGEVRRSWLQIALRDYTGYVLVLIGYLCIRAEVLGGFSLPPVTRDVNPLAFLDGVSRALTTVKVAGSYLWLFVWPATLSADYSYNAIPAAESLFEIPVLWGVFAWGGLLIGTVWSFHRDPRLCFCMVFTILTFLPVSNVVVPIGTIMAERLFYLPTVGLCLLVGLGWERAIQPSSSRLLRVGSLALIAVLCLSLAVRTILRNEEWRNTETLFKSVIKVSPENAKAYIFLGGALRNKSDFARALQAYDMAGHLYPDYRRTDAYFNSERGVLLVKLGRTEEAIEAFEQAATLDPLWGGIRNELGLAYASAGKHDRAETTLRHALAISPDSPHIHSSLSLVLNEQGRYQEALEHAEAALQRDPMLAWAQFNRGLALEALGRVSDAITGYERLLHQPPSAENATALNEARQRLEALNALGQSKPGAPTSSVQCPPGLMGCR